MSRSFDYQQGANAENMRPDEMRPDQTRQSRRDREDMYLAAAATTTSTAAGGQSHLHTDDTGTDEDGTIQLQARRSTLSLPGPQSIDSSTR